MQGSPGLEKTQSCKTSRLRKVCSQKPGLELSLRKRNHRPALPRHAPAPLQAAGTTGSASPQVRTVLEAGASAGSHRPGLQPGGLDPDPTTPRPPGPLASPRPRGRPPPPPPQPAPAAGGVQITRGRAAGGWMWCACAHREFPFAAAKRRSHPNRPIMGRVCCPVVQTRELHDSSLAGTRLLPVARISSEGLEAHV